MISAANSARLGFKATFSEPQFGIIRLNIARHIRFGVRTQKAVNRVLIVDLAYGESLPVPTRHLNEWNAGGPWTVARAGQLVVPAPSTALTGHRTAAYFRSNKGL